MLNEKNEIIENQIIEFNNQDVIEFRITKSILEYSNDSELVYNALLHWRWSQVERKRRGLFKSYFKGLDLSTTEEYSILVYIQLNPNTHLGEIKNYLKMEKSTVSESIKRGINKNWIEEKVMEGDRRKFVYKLTNSGNEFLIDAHEQMSKLNAIFFKDLRETASQQLLEILLQLK